MRLTTRGRLLLVLAAATALASLPLQRVSPALAGLTLLGLLGAARGGLSTERVSVSVDAPAKARAGRPFLATARATVEPPLPLRVEARGPAQARLTAVDATAGVGEAAWEAAVSSQEPGVLTVTGARVTLTDPLGLWERTEKSGADATVRVVPDGAYGALGAGAGAMDSYAKGPRAFQETVEVERVRAYGPGDRLRDVDWRLSSKLGRLFTRERAREAPRPVVAVVDATRTMRWRRHGAAMTSTATHVAMAVAGAARKSGAPFGLVAYSDQGVTALLRASHGRGAAERVADALARLPESVPLAGAPPFHGAEKPMSRGEKAFLARLAPFMQGPLSRAEPLEAAVASVAQASPHPSVVVLVTSVDKAPRSAVRAVERLKRRGHLVAVVSPSLPGHLVAVEEARRHVELVAWAVRNRQWARQRLARVGAPLIEVRPGGEMNTVEEVVAWTR